MVFWKSIVAYLNGSVLGLSGEMRLLKDIPLPVDSDFFSTCDGVVELLITFIVELLQFVVAQPLVKVDVDMV